MTGVLLTEKCCPEACCLPDGTCVDLPREECFAQGGTPQGCGTSCEDKDVECEDLQACCFENGDCQDFLPADCVAAGGIPQGQGTECLDTKCPDPGDIQACCLTNGSCVEITPEQCLSIGGTPAGVGTICDDIECGVCIGLCTGPQTVLAEAFGIVSVGNVGICNCTIDHIENTMSLDPDSCHWGNIDPFIPVCGASFEGAIINVTRNAGEGRWVLELIWHLIANPSFGFFLTYARPCVGVNDTSPGGNYAFISGFENFPDFQCEVTSAGALVS